MGNCQAVEVAAAVVRHPGGAEVERFYWPVTAQQVMPLNPSNYVALSWWWLQPLWMMVMVGPWLPGSSSSSSAPKARSCSGMSTAPSASKLRKVADRAVQNEYYASCLDHLKSGFPGKMPIHYRNSFPFYCSFKMLETVFHASSILTALFSVFGFPFSFPLPSLQMFWRRLQRRIVWNWGKWCSTVAALDWNMIIQRRRRKISVFQIQTHIRTRNLVASPPFT